MNVVVRLSVVLFALLTGTVAHAQSAVDLLQRNVDQQVAIQQGLQFGFLTVQEAADFTLRQANIEALQVEVLRDGWLGAVDAQRVVREQDALADLVVRSTRNWQVGDPYLPEAQRLLAQLHASIAEQQRLREALLSGQIREIELGRVLQQQALSNRQVAEQVLGGVLQPAPQVEYREYREYREPIVAPSFMLQFGNGHSTYREREWLRERELQQQRDLLRQREWLRERAERREREARHQAQERREDRREDRREEVRQDYRQDQRQDQRQERREDRRDGFRPDHRADKPAVVPIVPVSPATPAVPRPQIEQRQAPTPSPAVQPEARSRVKERGNDDDERRRGRRDQANER